MKESIYRSYQKRFVFRIFVLAVVCLLYVLSPQSFSVLTADHFFTSFSALHVIWLIWVRDIILQIIPVKGRLTLGSRKQFKANYAQPLNGFDREKLKQYSSGSLLAACKVLALWLAIIAVIGMLWFKSILTPKELLLLSAVCYVCDVFCVLYWCPLQSLIMKNRCCITCRIFNWDSLMIFSPLLFLGGFFSLSLIFLSLIVFISWEIRVFQYPERFWDGANEALRCSHCQEKLCQVKTKTELQVKVAGGKPSLVERIPVSRHESGE